MKFIKRDLDGILPVRGTALSAGYDLSANIGVTIQPGERVTVPTGVGWDVEGQEDYNIQGNIRPRSGIANIFGIDVLAGLIDADFEGEIGVILYNTGNTPFEVCKGDRIAQIVLSRFYKVSNDKVKEDKRVGGFGSTGKR